MSIKSGLFALITGVVLILLLGNPPVGDNLPEGQVFITSRSINGFLSWDLSDLSGTFKTAQVVSLLVFLVSVFVLGGLAGRARPLAAFIGGWGAAIGAAALASIVFSLIVGDDGFFGAGGGGVIDRAFLASGQGASVMIVLGWLFGVAVMLGSLGKGQPKPAGSVPGGGYAPPPSGPGYAPPDQGHPPAAAPAYAPPSAAPAAPSAPPPSAAPAPPPGAPDLGKPAPTPAPGPAGPQIGPPPDRTQVYGQPPQ